jgi:malonyl-CoA/methylmalonyl-CoA synthetase
LILRGNTSILRLTNAFFLAGYVGLPLPGVRVKLVTDASDALYDPHLVNTEGEVVSGELRVQGPSVFSEYWRRPEATSKEFDQDRYFKTGDIVSYSPQVA